MLTLALLVIAVDLAAAPRPAVVADSTLRVRVVDRSGAPVPFAVVEVEKQGPRVADGDGQLLQKHRWADSLRVRARRIGYREHFGYVRPTAGSGDLVVTMDRIAVAVDAVVVTATRQTPLARTGFYDRVERIQRGALNGTFITPEELEERNPSTVTQTLRGRTGVSVSFVQAPGGRQRAVVRGRGGCAMNIVVDGQYVETAQADAADAAPTSIVPQGTSSRPASEMESIDDLVAGRAIMAIEIYPSAANAPAEIAPPRGRGSCGIVAIWTGPRQ